MKSDELIKDYLCLALDLDNEKEILECVDELSDMVGYFKLNYAFTKYGPDLIKKIKSKGVKIFLDLKLHDIPNTIYGYSKSIMDLGIDILTVHTSGGSEMMTSIAESTKKISLEKGIPAPKIIGVTLLTSIDNRVMNNELNIQGSLQNEVKNKATIAAQSGLDGIVCSPKEIKQMPPSLPEDFYYVTPGIRSKTKSKDDHKRTSTFEEAILLGSKLLVIGREVLESSNRRQVVKNIFSTVKATIERSAL